MNVDLREHVLNRSASWLAASAPHRLVLSEPGDAVTLAGPLRIRVSVQARNSTSTPAGAQATAMSPLFDYTLRIPSGHTWGYVLADLVDAAKALGVNDGVSVIIDPVLGVDPVVIKPPLGTASDVCCDAGIHPRPDFGAFFPVGCEPCTPQIQPTLPPLQTPIDIPVAPGGCVRPRYFDGMFLTREDLEAEQRYHLVKNRLQNRAAGAGVVWGLDIGLQNAAVCVKPGFAWDCCGRDLVVTSPYLVDAAALLRDPAAAALLAQPGAHRMHLLLEHVECPDDPRPVHGDPCAADIARCEMARTRETVRLRLVPPRDFDGKGPIDAFLGAVAGLDWDPDNSPGPTPPADQEVPLVIHIANELITPVDIVPSTTEVKTATLPDNVEVPFTFTVAPTPGRTFAPETVVVRRQSGSPDEVVATLDATGKLAWKATSQTLPNHTGELMFVIRWRVQTLSADMFVRARFTTQPSARIMEVIVQPVRLSGELGPLCDHECCAPDGEAIPLFPTDPPFIHPHPDHPNRAADPAVLSLAWDYASSFLRGNGPAPGEIDPRVQAALRDLLATWCESLLYRGPSCGASPHGVVIGCALVDAGAIVSVDPWGGRRWSLQYGLLANWATQLGILPPDVLLSKLAALACCVGDLPRIGPAGPRPGTFHPDVLIDTVRARDLALRALVATRPLVRPAATDIAVALADAVTIAHLVDGAPAWVSRLAGAGVSTVGRLLSASPEALHERVLGGEHATELNALLVKAEQVMASIAKAVEQAFATPAIERRLTSRADLTSARDAVEKELTRRLAEANVSIDAGAVRSALTAAARGDRA